MKGKLAAMVMIGLALALTAGCETGQCPKDAGFSDTFVTHMVINASPETVFNYMWIKGISIDESGKATPEWIPEFTCVDYQGERGHIGRSCQATFKVAGQDYLYEYLVVEQIPNQRATAKWAGDIDGTFTAFVAPFEKGSRLTVVSEYSVDHLKGASRQQFQQDYERIIEDGLKTIKQKAEAMPAMAAVAADVEVSTISETNMVSVVIAAPVEKVFAYMTDTENFPEWHWTKVTNVQGQGLGRSLNWEAGIEGQVFRGRTVTVDYVPNRKMVDRWRGDAHGIDTWLFVPENGKTRVYMIQTGFVQGPHLTQSATDFIIQGARKNIEQALNKAKVILEK
jgi:uncharacterized protein YndB with AHSA1/START domain